MRTETPRTPARCGVPAPQQVSDDNHLSSALTNAGPSSLSMLRFFSFGNYGQTTKTLTDQIERCRHFLIAMFLVI
jgi:hypothetical protein